MVRKRRALAAVALAIVGLASLFVRSLSDVRDAEALSSSRASPEGPAPERASGAPAAAGADADRSVDAVAGPPKLPDAPVETAELPDDVEFIRLEEPTDLGGVYLAKRRDPDWVRLDTSTASLLQGPDAGGVLCVVRKAGGPIVIGHLTPDGSGPSFPEPAHVRFHFAPPLPEREAACHELYLKPVDELPRLQEERVVGLHPPFDGSRVDVTHAPLLAEIVEVDDLHAGLEYEVGMESAVDNVKAGRIDLEEARVVPPGDFELRWHSIPVLEVVATGVDAKTGVAHYRKVGSEGYSPLVEIADGRGWHALSYLRPGRYELFLEGTDWRSTEPPAAFSVDPTPTEDLRVEVPCESVPGASIAVSLDGEPVRSADVCARFETGNWFYLGPCPPLGEAPCTVFWKRGVAHLVGLRERVDLLVWLREEQVLEPVVVEPGAQFALELKSSAKRVFDEARALVRQFIDARGDQGWALLSVELGVAGFAPSKWNLFSLRLDEPWTLSDSQWTLPVRDDARYLLQLRTDAGATEELEVRTRRE